MAKDPKNFTGENMNALLSEAARHEQAKTEWKMFGLLGVVIVSALLVVAGAISLVAGLFR